MSFCHKFSNGYLPDLTGCYVGGYIAEDYKEDVENYDKPCLVIHSGTEQQQPEYIVNVDTQECSDDDRDDRYRDNAPCDLSHQIFR